MAKILTNNVIPPNPVIAFVSEQSNAFKLTPPAFRFLTNITNAINGLPFLDIGGVQVSQSPFGLITFSSGPLNTPNGLLPGNIGDIFISTTGGGGGVLFAKTSGIAGSTSGWSLIT